MRTFVWASVLFYGFFSVVKIFVLAIPDQKERGMTAVDALITLAFLIWGITLLAST